MSEKLEPCPCCGSVTDIEKNISASGAVWFSCDKCGVSGPYKNVEAMARTTTEEEAVTVWNNRVPEPGTSVIRWTRYDGTQDTLPDDGARVLHIPFNRPRIGTFHNDIDGDENRIESIVNVSFSWGLMEGDLWAYLPEPPEGME